MTPCNNYFKVHDPNKREDHIIPFMTTPGHYLDAKRAAKDLADALGPKCTVSIWLPVGKTVPKDYGVIGHRMHGAIVADMKVNKDPNVAVDLADELVALEDYCEEVGR